jgi:hypothetical protein
MNRMARARATAAVVAGVVGLLVIGVMPARADKPPNWDPFNDGQLIAAQHAQSVRTLAEALAVLEEQTRGLEPGSEDYRWRARMVLAAAAQALLHAQNFADAAECARMMLEVHDAMTGPGGGPRDSTRWSALGYRAVAAAEGRLPGAEEAADEFARAIDGVENLRSAHRRLWLRLSMLTAINRGDIEGAMAVAEEWVTTLADRRERSRQAVASVAMRMVERGERERARPVIEALLERESLGLPPEVRAGLILALANANSPDGARLAGAYERALLERAWADARFAEHPSSLRIGSALARVIEYAGLPADEFPPADRRHLANERVLWTAMERYLRLREQWAAEVQKKSPEWILEGLFLSGWPESIMGRLALDRDAAVDRPAEVVRIGELYLAEYPQGSQRAEVRERLFELTGRTR